ncbi:MAG: hypothetical protein NTY35_05535 [Planctomycetota bacterium]|nr:hypothetical protein [Planctomycetota bacterium]
MTRLPRSILACAVALALSLLSGCSSTGLFSGDNALDPEDVPAALEKATAALARDDAQEAVELLVPASRAVGLAPDVRDRVQIELEKSAERRIEQLSAPGSDPDDLADLIDLELPRQIAVQAGLVAARRYVEIGEPIDAYELLKRIDDKFPLHHERIASGNLMADIGLSLKDDTPTLFGWFDTLGEAQEILEYVILKTPWARRCDEAYMALSVIYEQDQDWRLAIERAEGLVLNHPGSPLAIQAQARVPELRLRMLASPEYDRQELDRARQELQEWLVSHGTNELEPKVRLELADCLVRLCESDLSISRFYHTVGNAFGAQRHARRAIQEARDAGDAERVKQAEDWQRGLPAAVNPISGTEALP